MDPSRIDVIRFRLPMGIDPDVALTRLRVVCAHAQARARSQLSAAAIDPAGSYSSTSILSGHDSYSCASRCAAAISRASSIGGLSLSPNCAGVLAPATQARRDRDDLRRIQLQTTALPHHVGLGHRRRPLLGPLSTARFKLGLTCPPFPESPGIVCKWGIHLTGVEWADHRSASRTALSAFPR